MGAEWEPVGSLPQNLRFCIRLPQQNMWEPVGACGNWGAGGARRGRAHLRPPLQKRSPRQGGDLIPAASALEVQSCPHVRNHSLLSDSDRSELCPNIRHMYPMCVQRRGLGKCLLIANLRNHLPPTESVGVSCFLRFEIRVVSSGD